MRGVKLIGYCRVSTTGQVRDGLGLATQERLIRAWAKLDGHRIVAWYRDEGVSGSNGIEDREALLDALKALKDGRAEGLVVSSLDRWARALTVQEAVLGKVWALGGRVFTVDSGEVLRDDPDDPMRTAMRQMGGVFAELERRLVIKRLRDGRATKAKAGGYASGGVPYGKRAEGGELVPDEAERRIVARVKALRAEGASYPAICQALTDEGYTPRRGQWRPGTVRRVALRP
jgi:DNA invertase Pin-like site-specific DNA recombinase